MYKRVSNYFRNNNGDVIKHWQIERFSIDTYGQSSNRNRSGHTISKNMKDELNQLVEMSLHAPLVEMSPYAPLVEMSLHVPLVEMSLYAPLMEMSPYAPLVEMSIYSQIFF